MWKLIGGAKGAALLALVTLVVGYIGVLRIQLQRADARARSAALDRDAYEARADTTRLLLRDSLDLYARRAVQVAQGRDSLERALGLERRARARVVAQLAALDTTASALALAEDSLGTRTATFHVERTPYTVDARVTMPPLLERRPELQLTIALDPIPLALRVWCGEDPGTGVRPATFAAAAPPWAHLEVTDPEFSPELCSPPPHRDAIGRRIHRAFLPVTAGAAAGALAVGLANGQSQDYLLGIGLGALLGGALAVIWP